MTALVNLAIITGMLVVVPVGLSLIAGPELTALRTVWPVGAVPAAVGLWLPRGVFAGLLVAGYALLTVALVLAALRRFTRHRSLAARELAILTALVTPAVAGIAMVAERTGYRLFGFPLETLRLTEAHFHFAGFAAALIAGLVCRAVADTALARAAALTVPGGTAIVFAGFFIGNWVELAGAAVLTTGMWLVGWLTWRSLRPAETAPATRRLLTVSAAVLVVTMLLALDWALGEAAGLPHLPITWMAATHGVANAFGFALCGVLAWRRLREDPI